MGSSIPGSRSPDSPSTRRAGCFITVGVLAVLALTWVISIWTDGGQSRPPRMIGSVWTAQVADGPRIFYVMEEERWERRIPKSARRGEWFTANFSIFTLHARDEHDGTLAKTTELARIDDAAALPEPVILGPQGRVLWLWNHGIEARDLETLDVLWTASRFA